MIRILMLAFLLPVGLFTSVHFLGQDRQQQRDKLWQEVDQANRQGLPRTAAEKLQLIFESAVADEQFPEAVKAICQRFVIEGNIEQPVAPSVIRNLQETIPQTPESMRPTLKTILAHWFNTYYQQNQWRFLQRTQTSQPPSEDFETWDLKRLLDEIDLLFSDALASSEQLRKIPIEDYDQLLVAGNVGPEHRPTLYDFIAFEALGFYALDEQIVRAQDSFDLTADSPIFASVDEFLAWRPESQNTSFLLKAIALYQELLRFHQDDEDSTAFLDANLHRLTFGRAQAAGSEAAARYKAALQRFADEHRNHPLSSLALSYLAEAQRAENELVTATQTAENGLARFPDSVGSRLCYNLIEQIKSRSAQIATEKVWNSAGPSIEVTYRNIEKVYFRLIAFDYTNWTWGNYYQPENRPSQVLTARVRRRQPVAEWSSDLPKTEDYRQRVERLPVNVDAPPGCYLLVASHKPDFSEPDNQLSMCEVWVSDLAIVLRNRYGSTDIAGQVTHAITGAPVAEADVTVKAWVRDGRNSREVELRKLKTDSSGMFRTTGRERCNHMIYVKHRDQALGVIEQNYKYKQPSSDEPRNQTVFFTDRSIYRPGQTIQFKGVCLSADQRNNVYSVMPGQNLRVVLWDANNQEVERREFRSNEFGSFSGSFTAPRGRATGQLRIGTDDGPGGNAWVRMEEYKRPKFYVEIEDPEKAFQLNDQVTVKGKATAYTGATVDSAKIAWRVVRQVQYPHWWQWHSWRYPSFSSESQEIAHGVSQTNIDGSFNVQFEAKPDLSVPRESQPVFTFNVFADVTDNVGETRSASQSVRIGYTSLAADLLCSTWQTAEEPVEIELSTTTLDGRGLETTGQVKIYRLKAPDNVQRARLSGRPYIYSRNAGDEPKPDLSDFSTWPNDELTGEHQLSTDGAGKTTLKVDLPAGAFRAIYETTDPGGQKVTAELPILVIDSSSDVLATKVPNYFAAQDWSVEPGEEFVAAWGTGYEEGRAYVELEHRGEILRSFWTDPDKTQTIIRQHVDEKLRGGFFIRVTFVRENRAYLEQFKVDVPWTNKKLTVKWEHFVSKLQPGGRETWSALISGPEAGREAAEMVAALYDASLDAFANHSWPASFGMFYNDHSNLNLQFQNELRNLRAYLSNWRLSLKDGSITYRHFPPGIVLSTWGYHGIASREMARGRFRGGGGGLGRGGDGSADFMNLAADAAPASVAGAPAEAFFASTIANAGPDLSQVTARQNLQETAFFFPHLLVDEQGRVRIEFEIPEALTKWKFLGFAHDSDMRTALLTDEIVTSKDLMVQPNPPRFLREGDVLEFSVKVSNQSATRQTGSARLTFADARTDENMDAMLSNNQLDQPFDIPAGQSASLSWRIEVPDFTGVLTYKAVGATDRLSDGEEGFLPVLSRRILVTESLPLPIRGQQTREFVFDRLKNAAGSDTLQTQSLTVQMTSNPAWYAVLALPYLMEYPHECSEQVFNRLYANALAQHIATSQPRIRRIFDQWRDTDALDSPLEKNEELRNVLLAESPWLLEAKKESQARRDVGVLFDANRLADEQSRALLKLTEMQYSDGSWPWFPGGRANDYITLYVTTGFGRLRHLGADVDVSAAIRAVDRLDHWIDQTYKEILRNPATKDLNHLSPRICLYLYGRSFFLSDKEVDAKYKAAVNYFLGQAKKYWVELADRQSQGHLAIALKRFGDLKTPPAIMASIKERAVTDEEMGMFWREGQQSWWWYRAPIETQALLIEAFDEVMNDADAVEDCKVWLLKQKQTQNWKTTKATADAIYGLLQRGTNLLSSDRLVQVKLGDYLIEPQNAEAGTGFYEQRFPGTEVQPEMGDIEVTKTDQGVAWGSLHWQYLEDISKIEPYEGTPLTLKKSLYLKKNTEQGPTLIPLEGPVQVGDELVTRVELRVDREMEYVHLKDYRGSGTEPVDVLSRYFFQDGLAYYQSTKDTASHFFIDYLPRGTYVFEYSVRVQHRGTYQTGIAELQCMYAPEFNSHSASLEVEVR